MDVSLSLPDSLVERAQAAGIDLEDALTRTLQRRLATPKPKPLLPVEERIRLYSTGMTSPWWWVRVMRVQVNRIDTAFYPDGVNKILAAGDPGSPERMRVQAEVYDGLLADAFFCIVALRHVIRYAEHYAKATEDPRAAEVAARFDQLGFPKLVRDLLEHFDEYRVGVGKHSDKPYMLPYDPNTREPYVDAESGSLGFAGISMQYRRATEEAERHIPLWQELSEKYGPALDDVGPPP